MQATVDNMSSPEFSLKLIGHKLHEECGGFAEIDKLWRTGCTVCIAAWSR